MDARPAASLRTISSDRRLEAIAQNGSGDGVRWKIVGERLGEVLSPTDDQASPMVCRFGLGSQKQARPVLPVDKGAREAPQLAGDSLAGHSRGVSS